MNHSAIDQPRTAGPRPLAGRVAVVIVAALLSAACVSPQLDDPTVQGWRQHAATLTADSAVPYRVGAYELVFADRSDVPHARRAALLVSLLSGQGHVEGFAEWGRAGEAPQTYAVGGWARQRSVEGEVMTVLELALERLDSPGGLPVGRGPKDLASLAVRVVVNEASGDVTLTRRR
jgi:hypothetical protein